MRCSLAALVSRLALEVNHQAGQEEQQHLAIEQHKQSQVSSKQQHIKLPQGHVQQPPAPQLMPGGWRSASCCASSSGQTHLGPMASAIQRLLGLQAGTEVFAGVEPRSKHQQADQCSEFGGCIADALLQAWEFRPLHIKGLATSLLPRYPPLTVSSFLNDHLPCFAHCPSMSVYSTDPLEVLRQAHKAGTLGLPLVHGQDVNLVQTKSQLVNSIEAGEFDKKGSGAAAGTKNSLPAQAVDGQNTAMSTGMPGDAAGPRCLMAGHSSGSAGVEDAGASGGSLNLRKLAAPADLIASVKVGMLARIVSVALHVT